MMILSDVAMMYTRINSKTLVQLVGMALEALISYPIYCMIIYSFCTDNLKPIRYVIHMLYVRFQLGWFNMPGKEVGPNNRVRLAGKAMVQAV